MADLPVAEGGRPGGGGGIPWAPIGAIVGIGALILIIARGSGSSGTTAAGTSINAALGSIQEQNLNLMGQLGSGINTLSTQASDYHDSELAAMSGMQTALSDQMNGIDTHLTDVNNALAGQLSAVDDHVIINGQQAQANFAALSSQQAALNQNMLGIKDAVNQGFSGVNASLVNYFQSVLNQYNALSQQIAGNAQASQAQYNALYNLGKFINDSMGQQFGGINYQLTSHGI